MKYVYFTSGPPGAPNEHDTQSGSIFGHAAAKGAMADATAIREKEAKAFAQDSAAL